MRLAKAHRRTLLLVIAWLLSSAPVTAQTTEWHAPAVGTTFEWRTNGGETMTSRIVAVSDFLVTEESSPGGRRARYFGFMAPEPVNGPPARLDSAQLKYF